MTKNKKAQDSLGACPECGADCVDSPSGVVCLNGHGGVDPVAPGGHPERCPGCGASFADALPNDDGLFECVLYECGTITRPGRMGHDSATRSRACELLEESVEVIHQLQVQVEASQAPRAVPHQSPENEGPVSAYIPARPRPVDLFKLRSKAQVWLEMAHQSLAVVLHQDFHPEPDRLRRVYGPDMKRAVQQLADLREEVLLFIELQTRPGAKDTK